MLRLLLLAALIPLVSFAPGFFFVRRMRRWDPLEKLAASLALSIVLLYLLTFTIYNTGLPWTLGWAVSAASALCLWWCWRDAQRLFAAPQDPYTRALLACRPTLAQRGARLPAIDDILAGRSARVEAPRKDAHAPVVIEAEGLTKTFWLRRGVFGRRPFAALRPDCRARGSGHRMVTRNRGARIVDLR